jgi:RecB family exonuclease
MSQMTFDGFTDENAPPSVPAVEKAADEAPRADTWYKGRVLSHSSISMYRACPQRWKFRYIDKVPEKPRSHFSFGKSVHTALEFLFEKLGEPWPSLEQVLSHYQLKWLREGYESPVQEKWFFQEGDRIVRGFYAKHLKDAKNALQVEYKFTVDIEGVPVLGYVDRIDKLPNGNLSIIDYKTGKAFDKSRVRIDPQMTLYQMACAQTLKTPVESVTLYHLNSLTPLTVPAHSRKQESDYRAVVVEAAKGIMEQKFEPKPDERGHCMWCDYAQICPAFAGKKAGLRGLSTTSLTELADRYGKLSDRVRALQDESEQVRRDIETRLRATGQTEAAGQHYSVRVHAPLGEPPALEVKPIMPEEPKS